MPRSFEPAIRQWVTSEAPSVNRMSCKLIMHWLENGETRIREQVFDRSPITIGRGVNNDCVLTDSTRVVSTKHAELQEREGVWWARDVGSVNGTILNGMKVVSKKSYELQNGTELAIGPYRLEFYALASPPIANIKAEKRAPVVVPTSGSAEDRERLQYLMDRAYGDYDGSSGVSLEQSLEGVVHRALEKKDPISAQSIIESLRATLRPAVNRSEVQSSPPPQPPPEPVPAVAKPRRVAHLEVSLARSHAEHVVRELGISTSSVDSEQMAKQIAAVLNTLFTGLTDAVRGRREFQKEFEVEATRILAWRPNPIKHADSAAEIAAILLDPVSCELTEQEAIESLHEVLQDLTLHQLGLMAGFRECLRGLLKELAPEVLSKLPAGESKVNKLGLLSGGSVRAEAAAWRKYVETHRRFREEEVKVFERILAPHFAKGYLSVHQARKRP